MAEDLYDYDDVGTAPRRRDNLFLWTIFILILIGVALACWIGSFYVFGHPEQPRSYRLLLKLKKIEPVRRFEVTAAPQGEFLTAQKLFEKYSAFTPLELQRENAELMRNFLKNFTETKKLVAYIRGRFEVVDAYELTSADMFPSGTVALMEAEEFPQVLLEHLFPATGSNLEQSKRLLAPGYPFNIEKTNDVTAVIHIERVFDGRMLFTVVPLHYPSYALKGGAGTFASEPPAELKLEAGVPVLNVGRIDGGLKRLAQLRSTQGIAAAPSVDEKKGPELVRLDTLPDGTKAPATGALPEMPVATPIPVRPPVAQRPPTTPPPLALNTFEAPRALPAGPRPLERTPAVLPATPPPLAMLTTPPPSTAAPPTTPLPSVSPQGVPLKPFLRSNQEPGLPSGAGGTWRTYGPGQQPAGRAVSPAEVTTLADRGDLGDRLYLSGNFLVTASGDNRVVLRPQGAEYPPKGSGAVRVIVDYPAGAVAPVEGSALARDAARGFQVLDVRRASDGTVNVFVREIAQP